jgi:UDP-N-acetylglucosamine 3-dehydrogenase
MNMQKVRFGVVGAGGITNHFHLPELKQIEEAEIVAVADLNENRARLTAQRWGIRWWYTSYLEMLERDDIDAVIVATPHPTHAEIAISALKADKHVMIQKPMATNSSDSWRIVEEARRHPRLKVMVLPFVYFDTPVYDYVKEILRENSIGHVVMAEALTSHSGPEKYQEEVASMFGEKVDLWYFDRERAHGGALLDLGVYSITRITYLLGRVKSVFGYLATLGKPTGLDDNNVIFLNMESGALAVAASSWTQKPGQNSTRLYGTKGTIFINQINTPLMVFLDGKGWLIPQISKEKEPQHAHRHFLKCILNDIQPLGSPEEGHHVVQVIEAAYKSASTGNVVQIT